MVEGVEQHRRGGVVSHECDEVDQALLAEEFQGARKRRGVDLPLAEGSRPNWMIAASFAPRLATDFRYFTASMTVQSSPALRPAGSCAVHSNCWLSS